MFRPHPDEVIRPGTIVPRLLPPSVTLERLRAAGIDHAIEVRFDDALRSLTPEAFLDALAPAIALRGLIMTPDSAFGHRRAGTLARVTAIGRSGDSTPSASSRCWSTARRSRRPASGPRCEATFGPRRSSSSHRRCCEGSSSTAIDAAASSASRPPTSSSTTPPRCRRSGSTSAGSPSRSGVSARATRRWSASGCGRPSTTTDACWSRSTCSTGTATCTTPRSRSSCSHACARSAASLDVESLVEQMRADEAEARRRIAADGG